jgi:hypothetical protein
MSGRLTVMLALLAAALVPAAARGDGLPLPVDDAGPTGVVSADGSARWVTAPAGRGTVVEQVDTRNGELAGTAYLPGNFTIPVVALDGTAGGLSQDARTLVLIKPRSGFPRANTTLVILNAHPAVDAHILRVRRMLTLRGDFSFDALSPDGRTAYLIQYVNKGDPTKYLVRALDSTSGRLRAKPIVDPHERGDEMNGYPVTRATSADGRWHYTLYDGATGKPFVHALDTQAGRAKCIDLPPFADSVDLYSMHLRLSGGTLGVIGPKQRNVANIDAATFRVSVPAKPSRQVARGDSGGGSSAPAGWIAGVGLLFLLAGTALTVRRRRRRPVTAA